MRVRLLSHSLGFLLAGAVCVLAAGCAKKRETAVEAGNRDQIIHIGNLIEPNDLDAIAVQGEAMVEMGATARAQENLQKLQTICGAKGCPQVAQLSGAISRGPTVASVKSSPAPKKD